jgi:hypothetical protein
MSKAIGSGVQFPVGNPLLAHCECNGIRRALHLDFNQLLRSTAQRIFRTVTLEWISEFFSHLGLDCILRASGSRSVKFRLTSEPLSLLSEDARAGNPSKSLVQTTAPVAQAAGLVTPQGGFVA